MGLRGCVSLMQVLFGTDRGTLSGMYICYSRESCRSDFADIGVKCLRCCVMVHYKRICDSSS
jgi:hypothetical protein